MTVSKHLIPREDENDLGPAMLALAPQERLFVRALFSESTQRGAAMRAAKAAGYGHDGSPKGTFSRAANKLFNRPRVAAAIAEVSALMLRSDAPLAVATVREIMRDPEHKDRLKAARTIIERADPVEQKFSGHMHHTIEDALTSDERGMQIYDWLRSMNVPREKLIETFGFSGLPRIETMIAERDAKAKETGATIDAEFTEIRAPAVTDDNDDED